MQIDAVTVGKTTTLTSSVSAVWGALTLNDLASIVGIAGVIIGLGIQLIFSMRKDHRQKEEHEARMAIIRDSVNVK